MNIHLIYTPNMNSLLSTLAQKVEPFTPYLSEQIVLTKSPFDFNEGTVSDFISALYDTAQRLSQQQDPLYAEVWATRLVSQFDCLQQAVEKKKKVENQPKVFKSSYRFSPHSHNLPREKRLVEYKKALRALNEKLAWLSQQSYSARDPSEKQDYIAQIAETEYRKQKCLLAIEELE